MRTSSICCCRWQNWQLSSFSLSQTTIGAKSSLSGLWAHPRGESTARRKKGRRGERKSDSEGRRQYITHRRLLTVRQRTGSATRSSYQNRSSPSKFPQKPSKQTLKPKFKESKRWKLQHESKNRKRATIPITIPTRTRKATSRGGSHRNGKRITSGRSHTRIEMCLGMMTSSESTTSMRATI